MFSTTFCLRHKLNQWVRFTNHNDTFLTFCALREPRSRFLSSIGESICRIYIANSEETKRHFADVPVSKEIFEFLAKGIMKSGCFLKASVKTIEEFGFFNAHHEPMTRFLINENNQLEVNPITINVEDVDVLSMLIYSLDGNTLPSQLSRHNVNEKGHSASKDLNTSKNLHTEPPLYSKESLKSMQSGGKITKNSKDIMQHLCIKDLPIHPLKYKFLNQQNSWEQIKWLIYEDVKKTPKISPSRHF